MKEHSLLHCETPRGVRIETEPKHTGAQNKHTHAEVQLQTGRARQRRKQGGGGLVWGREEIQDKE